MLSFVIAGLAVGALYAMSAMALVVTYNASRVFNFAQGGMAFFLAYCFFFLSNPDTGLGWNSWLSAALVVLIVGPLLGLFLWWILLGKLGNLAPLTKVAVMIGLQVALVAVTTLIFGHDPVYLVYGPVGEPSVIFSIFDVNVSNEQFIIIESMKMEIPVLAPDAGTLKEILVIEGESVEEGQVVAVIEI